MAGQNELNTNADSMAKKIGDIKETPLEAALTKVKALNSNEFEELFKRIPGINGGMHPKYIPYYTVLQKFVESQQLLSEDVMDKIATNETVIKKVISNKDVIAKYVEYKKNQPFHDHIPGGGIPIPHLHLDGKIFALSDTQAKALDAQVVQNIKHSLGEAASIGS